MGTGCGCGKCDKGTSPRLENAEPVNGRDVSICSGGVENLEPCQDVLAVRSVDCQVAIYSARLVKLETSTVIDENAVNKDASLKNLAIENDGFVNIAGRNNIFKFFVFAHKRLSSAARMTRNFIARLWADNFPKNLKKRAA
jgi:hypothetical protein